MKKFLSALLAAAIAASMGVTAFAKTSDESADELYVFGSVVNRDANRAYIGVTDDPSFMTETDPAKVIQALKMDDVKLTDLKVKAKITQGKQYVGYAGFGDLHGYQFIVLAFGNDMNIDNTQFIDVELKVTNKNGKTIMDETKFRIKLDDDKNVIDEKDLGTLLYSGSPYGEWDQSSKTATVDLDMLNGNKEIMEDLDQATADGMLPGMVMMNMVSQRGKIRDFETLNSIPYNFLRVVDFDKAEEIELESNLFYFTVSAAKQGKLPLIYNNKAIPKVEALFSSEADLNFISFPANPEFDFTGKASVILPDEDVEWYLYQINRDGTMAPVKGAALNEDGDAIEFKTRVLGTYLLSDEELRIPDQEEEVTGEEETAPEAESKENPSTGL